MICDNCGGGCDKAVYIMKMDKVMLDGRDTVTRLTPMSLCPGCLMALTAALKKRAEGE